MWNLPVHCLYFLFKDYQMMELTSTPIATECKSRKTSKYLVYGGTALLRTPQSAPTHLRHND